MSMFETNTEAVAAYLKQLQDRYCAAFEAADRHAKFREDSWERERSGDPKQGILGGGVTRVLSDGALFERAGVNFSMVEGRKLPPSATVQRPQLIGRSFKAMGVSVVLHPKNPYVPTAHCNVRLFVAEKLGEKPAWWFGGGYDLTPYYGFEEDAREWHRAAREACAPHGAEIYPKLKKWCDDYFVLKHRGEQRGIGGLFFDDWAEGGFDKSFALMRSIGDSFPAAYLSIARRRLISPYGARQRDFQLYRRGRYAEFNLVWDRGTLFGLQTSGRTESILMSMPPGALWRYNWQPEPDSPEADLNERFLKPRDWLGEAG